MAPPPLPADYGSGTGGGGGWNDPAPPPAAAPAPANDDWGWDAPAPVPPAQENNAGPRYSNAPIDDPWSNATTDDNNYNQAGSSNDPFDPFDKPPSTQQHLQQHTTATANTNQVTLNVTNAKTNTLFLLLIICMICFCTKAF